MVKKVTKRKKYTIGYTQGVFDMFHIGHLNLIRRAKKRCDYLIVGINSDKLVKEYKNKMPIISEKDRKEIVSSIKDVDNAVIVNTLNKESIYRKLKFDAVFIGSDWLGNERWKNTEKQLKKYNVDVVYLPYTTGVSSTLIKKKAKKSSPIK